MSNDKTILIAGYGQGISDAVASRFADEGFALALLAREQSKLDRAVASFEDRGVKAVGLATNVGDVSAVREAVAKVRDALGPITVIHWNAAAGLAADWTTCDLEELRSVYDVGTTGLLAAIQAALPDFRARQDAAVLVTGGGFAVADAGFITQIGAMGLAFGKTMQHRAVELLHARLAGDGIYVGEIMVKATVKGTAFDRGDSTLEASTVAEAVWKAYQGRDIVCVSVP